jgi:ABC-type transport system involved in multi-copper enzyme maturation permease subunit
MGRWGLGPVFAYEWLRASRRWQLYALRALFVAALGAGLAFVWWVKVAGQPATIRGMAAAGEAFFYALVGTQLALVLLAAPAYTAGSICLDKARGTLYFLLATDLSDAEIVLGKLAARLVPVLGLVACAVPVLAGAILLGGIDPEAALGATLVTLGSAVFVSALALAISVWARQTHEALLATYLVGATLVLFGPMWAQWQGHLGLPPLPGWAEASNPFWLAFLPYLRRGSGCLGEQAVFLGVTLALSAVLTGQAVLWVRAVALRQAGRPARPRRRLALDRLTAPARWLPGPSLDRNPVLWREWRRRSSRWGRAAWVGYGLLALLFSLLAVGSGWATPGGNALAPWVNALQVPFGLLLLSVLSVTSLAEERARGTLDVLLTTPLTTGAILIGKWWATYRTAVLLAILPGFVVVAGVGRTPDVWAFPVVICLLVLSYGAALTSLGLALATWIPRPSRALALGVILLVLVTVVPFLPILLSRGILSEQVALASPFFGMGALTDMSRHISNPANRDMDAIAWAVEWLCCYVAAAIILFLLTWLTFDRCLGRAGSAAPRSPRSAPASGGRQRPDGVTKSGG